MLFKDLQEHNADQEKQPPKEKPPLSKEVEKKEEVREAKTSRRYQIPEHLEIQEEIIDPQEFLDNPEEYRHIGEEVTEEIDVIPTKLIKKRIIRRKYVSIANKSVAPIVAPAPKRLIDGGIAGVGLLVHIMLGKYCDHLPLYRQEKIFRKRHGITNVTRKQMCTWIGRVVTDWLMLIYDRMRIELLKQKYIGIDDVARQCEDGVSPEGVRNMGAPWAI